MVTQTSDFDLKQVFESGNLGPADVDRAADRISHDFTQFEVLRETIRNLEDAESRDELSPSLRVALGVGYYLTGSYNQAIEMLKKGDGGALALFYQAKSLFASALNASHLVRGYFNPLAECISQQKSTFEAAFKCYEQAEKAGYGRDTCTLGKAATYQHLGAPEKSLKELDKLSGPVEQTAEYLYQRGATVAMLGANPDEAYALYKRAEQADKNHPGALFGLALETERGGYDEAALELYKRAVACFPTNIGLLCNLGLLYEDLDQYEQAVICYQRILDSYPNHKRAKLFLKDAKASNDMHFDEEAQRKRDRMGQILNLPVSDFELSVRSRNCLKNMGIMSLGDLCRHTEQELLASKNFGETSLVEIREMLTLKGLKLGQFATDKHVPEPVETESLSPDEQAVLLRPVTDLNLSVRARKCMNRLNIQSIGELVRRTADELLDCKNFGVTSLKEIREKLVNFNIKLRGE